MLKNFQHYFRFYLATFLFGLLLAGIRWQAAPLGGTKASKENKVADKQMVISKIRRPSDVAVR